MLEIIVLIVSQFIYWFLALNWQYFAQIKEYRLDRILATAREFGFGEVISPKGRFPSKTLRNFLIFLILLLFALILAYMSVGLYFQIILSGILAFFAIILGVYLSGIISSIYRKFIIFKAYQYLNQIRKDLKVIAITGSTGKSSVKELLGLFFAQYASTAHTQKNHNTDIGVALDVKNQIKPDTKYFVAEVGTYCKGEIEAVVKKLQPNVAIVTSITDQHLALQGSFENLIKSKMEIASTLQANDLLIMPKNLSLVVKQKVPPIWKDLQKRKVKISTINEGTSPLEFVQALLPILCEYFQFDKSGLSTITQKLAKLPSRPYKKQLEKSINFYDDSGSTSSMGLMRALRIFEEANSKIHKKYFVTRGIIELGSAKKEVYHKICNQILLSKTGQFLLLDRDLYQILEEKGFNRMLYFVSEKNLALYLQSQLEENDLLYLTGRYSDKFIFFINHYLSSSDQY